VGLVSRTALTARQADALEWLRRVGKATRTSYRAAGWTAADMDGLVAKGVATQESIRGQFGGGRPANLYRPVDPAFRS
jgi:hypothetical protein